MIRLGADGPPVGHVVLGELAGPLDVAHLGGRAPAAPLLAHQSELDTGPPEDWAAARGTEVR